MGKGFNSSSSKNAHTKRYERKSENSGRFGSSGASDKRRSGTSDKNQPRQPLYLHFSVESQIISRKNSILKMVLQEYGVKDLVQHLL